jgi:hypothetical protein
MGEADGSGCSWEASRTNSCEERLFLC